MSASFPEIRLRARTLRPYLAKLLWSLQPVSQDGLGTFAVDEHMRVYYDPQVLKTWGLEKCAAVLLHEVLHVFLKHTSRCQRIGADAKLWNVAGDLEINCILRRDGLAPMPLGEEALYPEKYGFAPDLTAEEFYALLCKQDEKPQAQDKKPQPGSGSNSPSPGSDPQASPPQDKPSDDGASDPGKDSKPSGNGPADKPAPSQGRCGSCANGHADAWELPADDPDAPAMPKVSRELLERAVAEDIKRAAQAGQGRVPAGLVSYADSLLDPQVPWQEVLGQVLRTEAERQAGYDAQTYARPHRHTAVLDGGVLPSWYSPRLTVGAIVDTSGSMGADRIRKALTETQAILDGMGARVLFTSVDAQAAEVVEVLDLREVRLQGGGGTDMRVGIQAILDVPEQPSVILLFTDCDTPWPAEPTPIPLVVVAIDKYPWAQVPDWAITITVN